MMKQKGGHGIQARITIDDIPQEKLDLLNSSTVTYEIRDEKTGVLESSVTRPMRSFTANFLRLMWGRMTGTACTGGLDINDTAIDESSGKATNLKCVGATTGLKKFGICIGTGTGAVAQTDNKLTWDTGFSTYGATTLKTATTISGSDIYFEIQKAFTNNTGSTRTIYEAGLCTTGEGTEADNNTNVLIARELTNGATGTAVATGKTITVVFKISSTFTTDGTISKTMMDSLMSAFIGGYGSFFVAKTDIPANCYAGASLVFNNVLYVMGGLTAAGAYTNAVYSTIDGVTWTTVRSNGAGSGFTACYGMTALVFNSKMWLIGGNDGSARNYVYYSTDGSTWTQARADGAANGFTAVALHASVIFDSKMWVIGGNAAGTYINAVYYSTDGISWTQARADGAGGGFTKTMSLTSVVFGGKMWTIGGRIQAGTEINEVCYSTDGVTWTQARADGAANGFDKRWAHTSFVFGGEMWVVGGYGTVLGYQNSIYSSTDGATWTQRLANGSANNFTARYGHCGCFFNSKIYVVGGYTGSYVKTVYDCTVPVHTLKTGATMDDYSRIDATSAAVYGITVGTGTTNFAGTDNVLITPIADGSGASQLDYGDMTDAGRLSEPTVTGSDNIMRLERDFTNNSGGSITIKEVGLSAKGLDALGLLLMRGKVDKAVADGASVRVAIELETTV